MIARKFNGKKIWSYILFCVILFSACGFGDGIRIYDLRCEHLVDPLGIDVETPRFSWKISDPVADRGQHQTAYRILVSSSPGKLKPGKADIWDSEIVASSDSHLIPYGGVKLESGKGYYWKAIVYDYRNRASKWSATAHFSMGLLDRSDWKGMWIKHPSAAPEKHTWFRRKLNVTDNVESAYIHIASTGYHELYINGRKVDERILAPALARLDKRVLYVTYDIAPLLTKGDNIIALWYGPGWSRYNFFAPSVEQAFLLQLNGNTKKGETFTLHSNNDWKCAESYSSNSGGFQFLDMGGETVDGRLYSGKWNALDFDDSNWISPIQVDPLKRGGEPTLSAQMTDITRIIETIPAKQLIDTIPGMWRVDMGKNFTGFVEASFSGLRKGDTIVIKTSDRHDVIDEYGQQSYYIARGEDGETFRNRFNFSAGRYLHFVGLNKPPKLSAVKGYAISSAAGRTGYFECSDSLFNRIYDIDRWTYEICTLEGFTVDCPHRERLGYGSEGAYQTTWGLGLPCFASGAFYIKNVRDWSDVQTSSGWIHNTAPQINHMWGGPLYGNANMNIAYEHYLAHGDKKILEQAYGTGKRWLEFLNTHVANGMLVSYDSHGYFIGDWLGPGHRTEFGNTVEALFFNNCAYAMTLELFCKIAELLGRDNETAIYRERLAVLRAKVHETYYNPDVNSYLNGDQVRTSFALYAGIFPDSLRHAALKHLENDMTGAHPYFDIGSSSRYPYFKTLFAYPQFHEIISVILSRTSSPGYGYILSQGETAWTEVWEANEPARIHTSFTGISAWFIKGLAGIEPSIEGPGYRIVSIRPHVTGNLSYAKAAVESPTGLIESAWRKTETGVVYDISVPVGSKARIYLPSQGISENGQPVANVQGIEIVEEKDGIIQILANPGKYKFEIVSFV
jgi:alpha-L-rhamnosidase